MQTKLSPSKLDISLLNTPIQVQTFKREEPNSDTLVPSTLQSTTGILQAYTEDENNVYIRFTGEGLLSTLEIYKPYTYFEIWVPETPIQHVRLTQTNFTTPTKN